MIAPVTGGSQSDRDACILSSACLCAQHGMSVQELGTAGVPETSAPISGSSNSLDLPYPPQCLTTRHVHTPAHTCHATYLHVVPSRGVEARVPFLDRNFLDVAMAIDPAEKMIDKSKGGWGQDHRPLWLVTAWLCVRLPVAFRVCGQQ